MLYELIIDILTKDQKYKFFVKNLKKVEEVYNKKSKKSKKDIKAYRQIEIYIKSLESFYEKYVNDIIQFEKLIAYNYVLLLIIFYKYVALENKSLEYLNEFRKFAIRVMEVALFLQKFQLNINDLFFNNNQKSFYENLIDIYELDFNTKEVPISENRDTLVIANNCKIQSDGIFIGNEEKRYQYVSTVNMPYAYTKISLAAYLRLQTRKVNNVYIARSVIKKDGGGGGGFKFVNLERLNPYPKELYYENKIVYNFLDDKNSKRDQDKYDLDNDELIESIDKSRKRLLNSKDELYSIRDAAENYEKLIEDENFKLKIKNLTDNNSYKKFKINTAIGHLKAKANLTLPSKYTVPNIHLLCKFLSEIKDKKTFEYKLLVTSILLGIEPKRIIAMILKLTTELEIVNTDTIRVDLTTAYAQVSNVEIYKKTKNKVEFAVPVFIEDFFSDMKTELFNLLQNYIIENKTLAGKDINKEFEICKNTSEIYKFMQKHFEYKVVYETYNGFLEEQDKGISKYLIKEKKLFSKTIVLTPKKLHTLSLHYYKQFHNESDINLLFLQHQTANIRTKNAYVASTKKLSSMTLWIVELMTKLSISNTRLQKPIKMDSDYSGSKKIVEPKNLKIFLKILMSLNLKNQYANVTLKMIYLRYVFSILFASRPYYFSVNLYQYSKREKLLFIHEKAKNIYNSKRIVPVTELGDKYIQYFFKLREEFNIVSYSPVILRDDGKVVDFDKKNLYNWLEQHEQEIAIKCTLEEHRIITNFLKDFVFDVGRHIFATYAHNGMEVSQDYIDAMLNHFKMGTQDQGMYCTFDNQEYFREIRKFMHKIEKDYIPVWSEL